MARPLVSVIVPFYNAEGTICETVQSVLSQTFKDFELILIDDGSTDRSVELISRIEDSRLRMVHQPNQERAVARNRGIQDAQGEWIAFLDADDLWLEQKLEKQLHWLEMSPEIGLVYSDLYYFDNLTGKDLWLYSKKFQKLHRGNVLPNLLRVNFIQSPTPLIRRTILDQSGWFDPKLPPIEDWDLWIRISSVTEIDYVPEPLARYRYHPSLDYWEKAPESMLAKNLYLFDKWDKPKDPDSLSLRRGLRRGRALAYYNYGLAQMKKNTTLSSKAFLQAIRLDPRLVKSWIRLIQLSYSRMMPSGSRR